MNMQCSFYNVQRPRGNSERKQVQKFKKMGLSSGLLSGLWKMDGFPVPCSF